MFIHMYDNNGRAEACAKILASSPALRGCEQLVLLPIPTSRDGVHLGRGEESLFAPLSYAEEGAVFAGYSIPKTLVEVLRGAGAVVCDCATDERFLADNAELTAQAALGIILGTARSAPCDLKVGVVGYGRIGKSLTRLLLYLGSEVCVYTKRREVMLDLCESGVGAKESSADADLGGLDILVNTAPATLFDTSDEERFPRGLRVMELASGDNFPDREIEKYPSLPARVFPKSAGRVWAESVERLLMRGGGA